MTSETSSVTRVLPGTDAAPPAGLDVRQLYVSYGSQAILHGVDLTVPAGSCVAMLGTNGAGKTTLMNAIAGLIPSTRGEIALGGQSILRVSAHRIAGMGVCYVPEGRGVFPDLSIAENLQVSIGRSAGGHDAFFEHFPQLRSKTRRLAGTLSGGEQQMLAMAPALLGDYRLLLVDELSLGLAPLIVEALFGILATIRAAGTSVLLVEQFADRALALADTAYVLRKGNIVFNGKAAELRNQPDRLHALYLGDGSPDEASDLPDNARP